MNLQTLFRHKYFEPALVFMLFCLPSALKQFQVIDFNAFNSINFHLINYIIIIPQAFLILYLMNTSHVNSKILGENEKWHQFYGFNRISIKSVLAIVILLAAMWVIFIIISMISFQAEAQSQNTGWQIKSTPMLFLYFITSQVSAWWEEILFRSFLMKRLIRGQKNPLLIMTLLSVVFGMLHFYQGIGGFIFTAAIGMLLSVYVWKKNDIVSAAVTHGLFNFTMMLFVFLQQAPQ